MRTWGKLAIVLVAVAVVGLVVAYTLRYGAVTVMPVPVRENVAITVFGLGTVEARVLTKVGFKVAGTLTELKADHGDHVKAGQVLARIDSSEQKAKLAKAKAQLASADAAVQVSHAAARKAESLFNQRRQINQRRQALLIRQAISVEAADDAQHNEGVARADVLVAESDIEVAKARRDDAQAQFEYETVVLAQHELIAPFGAVVVQRGKELGAVMGPGEALFTLVDSATVWVLAYVDEGRAGDIRIGQRALVRLRSLPQHNFEGHVARVGIESDRVNEERRVYVVCDNCSSGFFLGEQAEVFITTDMLPRALMAPEVAVEPAGAGRGLVWTVEDGRLNRRRVVLGKRTLEGLVEISDGVPPGAVVAARPGSGYYEGRAARIVAGGQ